jgi:glutamate--cysteine ligase
MNAHSSSTGPEALANLMRRSCIEPSCLKIGIEVERIGMWRDGSTLAYESRGDSRPGARKLLEKLGEGKGWKPKLGPAGEPLGFTTPLGNISLEPGSQLEFSANAVRTLDEMQQQLTQMEGDIEDVTGPWGLHWIGLGVNPHASIETQDVIPLPRYQMMNDYFARTGKLGRAMMRLTSSLQFNFDYCSEASALRMLRASVALAPVSYALFNNSPLYQDKVSPFQSFRSEIWRDTDPARTGIFLHEVFQKDYGFLKYADRVWNLPLMYAENEAGNPVPANGLSLKQISEGALQGVHATETNLRYALAQMFTEARWKTGYLEVRSVDGLGPRYRMAAAAFWTGLMYCKQTSEWISEELGIKISAEDRNELWIQSTIKGLETKVGKISLFEICEKLFDRSHASLVNRGHGEEKYLAPLKRILEKRQNPAQEVLEYWEKEAKGDLGMLIDFVSA